MYYKTKIEIKKYEEYRTRKILSLFGFIITNGFNSDFIYTGKWFKYVTVKEQKCEIRYLDFDDGYTYQYYWSVWTTQWKFIKLTKIEIS